MDARPADADFARLTLVYGVGVTLAGVALVALDGNTDAAVGLILLGLGLTAHLRPALAAAVATLGIAWTVTAVTLGGIVAGAPIGPAAAACLLLHGAAIALLATPARAAGPHVALVAGTVGLVRLVAWLYGADTTTGWGSVFHGMSLGFAVLVVLLSQGIGAAMPGVGLTALLSENTAVSRLASRLILGVTSAPIAIGYVALQGQDLGLYPARFGVVLFAATNVVVLVLLTHWAATQLVEADRAQREREAWLATTLSSIGDGVIATDRDGRVVRINPVATELTGWSADDAAGRPLSEVFDIISEDTRQPAENPAIRVLNEGVVVGLANHTLLIARDGTERPIADSGAPIRAADGAIQGVVLVFRDQTEAHQAQEALQASARRLDAMSEAGLVGIAVADGDHLREANDAFLAAIGRSRAELDVGLTVTDAFGTTPRAGDPYRLELARADGTRAVLAVATAALDATRSISFVLDLTELEVAREAHHASQTAVRTLESQLQQAQKMEAIGSLAGGVAHDFNNLLSAVLGYAAVIDQSLPEGDPIREDVDEIRMAGQRAADLTRQLLAFSRRQVLHPRVVELNAVVDGMMKMLRRLVPESIHLSFAPRADRSAVEVDPGQFEQVLLNLVLNARDAMPGGGRIGVSTSGVDVDASTAADHLGLAPGPHVVLEVSDNGQGMDRDTQARIFEPFFTTKDVARGTGLGLAVVFGIVQQSGGTIWVYSEPGVGTTFKVYLPSAARALDEVSAPKPAPGPRGTETILLVEDHEQLRRLAERVLVQHGYRVLVAADGRQALAMAADHPDAIDLLLTDVVMPNMSGSELDRHLRQTRPRIRTLFMSGFTDDAVVQHGVLEASVAFLQKPILPDVLLAKVREVLAS